MQLNTFECFYLAKNFSLRTDHAALRNLLRRDLPPTTRVERWILRLSEYTFRIEYQKGQDNVIADDLSRLPFAAARETENNHTSDPTPVAACEVVQSNSNESSTQPHANQSQFNQMNQSCEKASSTVSMTSVLQSHTNKSSSNVGSNSTSEPTPASSTAYQPQCSSISASIASANTNLSLVLPDFNYDEYRNDSDADTYDSESDSDPEEEEAIEEESEESAELCNFHSTSAPIVDLPISREGLTSEDFTIPTREEFSTEQKSDIELNQLREWIEKKQCPSADELAGLSSRMKAFAQLYDQLSLREDVIVIKRHDDPERELTVVPSSKVDMIIRFYHEGPGGAHQAPKATSVKIIRCFCRPDLKRDVRLYIACCPVCERFSENGPYPESWAQVDGCWRPRRLPGDGYRRRQGLFPANPARQSLCANND